MSASAQIIPNDATRPLARLSRLCPTFTNNVQIFQAETVQICHNLQREITLAGIEELRQILGRGDSTGRCRVSGSSTSGQRGRLKVPFFTIENLKLELRFRVSKAAPPPHPLFLTSAKKNILKILRVHTNSQEKVISIGLTPFCSKHSKLVLLRPHKTRQSNQLTVAHPLAICPLSPHSTRHRIDFLLLRVLPLGFISTPPLRPLGPHLSRFRSHQSDISPP